MKVRPYVLIFFALILFIFSYYSHQWSIEFVHPCCSGLCGQAPPSFWECTTVGFMATFQIVIGCALILIGLWDYTDEKK